MTGGSLYGMASAPRGRWYSVSVSQSRFGGGGLLYRVARMGILLWACYARIALFVRGPLRVAPSLSTSYSE